MAADDPTPLAQLLSVPIILSDRLRHAAAAANSFKSECSEVDKQAERITLMLRSAARYATTTASLYDTPVRRIVAEVDKNLSKALALVHK
ncbi:hypothetical protein DCAR_0727657 [Daucus carota subsp. sativus]|uniref:DUF7792 domain-containing protein n=1 Tax=Daucus carota subsp. sativus TaxID=79200 RepID=A0A175YAV1_DAUCS|nr:hypothetical protein DCAR_0727657 [Daucus carota subsp. sativus]